MAHRKKKIGAQLVEDEDYQLRHEKVAGIGIAKDKGDVCTRLPPAREGGRRRSRVEQDVPARARDILELGARLIADGVELVIMESHLRLLADLVLPAGIARADGGAGELLPGPAAGRAAEDRPAGLPVAGPARGDGPAAPLVRAAAGGQGAARPDPRPPPPGPRPGPGVAAAGEAAGRRPDQAVGRAVVAVPGQDRPADPGRPRRRRARPEGPGRPRPGAAAGPPRRPGGGPGRDD